MELKLDVVYNEDCIEGMKKLPDNCVDCCVTSPPYYNLRDYGIKGQIGLEETPPQYVDKMCEVFGEVYRVLKPEGTLWLNIGDTYNGTKTGNTGLKWHKINSDTYTKNLYDGCKEKDLIGIPWMTAFALRDRVGFWLRNEIIWNKMNCMPESVTDRLVKSHEHIFLFAKSKKYYFDHKAIQEPSVTHNPNNVKNGKHTGLIPKQHKNLMYKGLRPNSMHIRRAEGFGDAQYEYRNKRDVWSVNTKPDPNTHFAVFPEQLIEPCIKAGCPEEGVVLDPFMGSGTTARVAKRQFKHFIGFELNPEYIKIINKKTEDVMVPSLF